MDILKFALLMGLVGFIGHYLPIDSNWVFMIAIFASVINAAVAVEREEDNK